jgi:glycosyltransferase involved in cell wall biosynthesis
MMSRWAWNHHGWRKRLARILVHPGALKAVHGWHATSDLEADEIRALGFTQPICVAPNGISPPDPGTVEAAARHWHEAYPRTADRPVALFYSRFHRKKRVIELIDTWLENAPRDWILLVAGIPQEYSVAKLQDYLLRNGGTQRVIVVDGTGQPPPYAVASLFLLPSHNENFGLSIAEALAHGVPALVTDTTPWLALNDHGGWCVPWSAYGAALRSATGEPVKERRMRSDLCRGWALREYSWEVPARRLTEFYRQLNGS